MWWLTVLAQMTSDAMRSTVWRMSSSLKKHSNCQRIWILLNISRIASASSTTRIQRCKRWYSRWMHSKATISATFLSIPRKGKTERTNEYSIFEYHLKPEFDFEQEIFSNMDTMEVLEPQWLREDIAEKLRNLTKKYQI